MPQLILALVGFVLILVALVAYNTNASLRGTRYKRDAEVKAWRDY